MTRNPWLEVPLADYEAHMAMPQVGKAQLLAETLARNIEKFEPKSVAIPGCAGGNGFARVPSSVERLIGIDINPDYIEQARLRFAGRRPQQPELIVGDVEADAFDFAPVDMVFAGLLFEYVDIARVLDSIGAMLNNGGALVTVLQLPDEDAVTSHLPYATIGTLSSLFRFVQPEAFRQLAGESGFRMLESQVAQASGGKQFHVQSFRLEAADTDRD